MKNSKYFWIGIAALIISGCSKTTAPAVKTSIYSDKIESLLTNMTLEEKIGQMNQYNGFWDATGPAPSDGDAKNKYDHLKRGLVGSVLNVAGAENTRKMQELVVNESRLGIPLIFGLDVIHGHKTVNPVPLAESASWDMEAIEAAARMSAIEASARGISWTFAPMVDISRDARWGRVMEGAGEDPYLGCMIAKARIKGFQGDDLSQNNTIAATAKHFAAYGFAEAGRDYNTADIGTSTLYNIVFPPFKASIEAGVSTVMNSFNVLNGIPATGDKFLQRDILKGEWGFDGFVISDWGSAKEMIDHGYAEDLKHAAVIAANAGCDMDMESYAYVSHLKNAVEEGLVDIKYIDDAVRRVLKVKEDLGLFEDPYKYCDVNREKELINHPDHHASALEMAKKSIVLLKNEEALLPLGKDEKGIAVIGALANDKNSPLGSWRIGSDDNTAISVVEGLKEIGVEFEYANGVDLITGPVSFINEVPINNDDRSGMDEAVALAQKSEKVIMVLGEHGFQSGEGRSRTKLGLPGLQQELLEAVYAVNPNIILVVMSGRPLVLTWADQNVPSILQTWQLGTQSGNAIAQTLFGENNPGGKLPMCFPRSEGQLPLYYNHLKTGRPGPSQMVFWTHYIDEKNDPLYPFGFGLSYTDFEYGDLNVVNNFVTENKVIASVSLKNTGDSKGVEVVQLYIRDLVASVSRPVKELKSFERIELEAGESKNIDFVLDKSAFGFYDNDGKFIVEPGEFEIFIGGDSKNTQSVKIKLNDNSISPNSAN